MDIQVLGLFFQSACPMLAHADSAQKIQPLFIQFLDQLYMMLATNPRGPLPGSFAESIKT